MHMPNVPGSRWQDRRAELDMDQHSAAEALEIAQGTLRNIETTPSYLVSLRVIHRAARLYSTTAQWLQGKEDDESPAPAPEPATPARKPSGDPKGPTPRKDSKTNRTGPRRDDMQQAS